ncbi:MAG: HAD family hydrolase, partial [Thermoleophilaceae bacterium]
TLAVPELPLADARAAMLESIRFEPYPDAEPALRELRDRGFTLVVASNWDCSLREVLAGAGLATMLDGVVTSAEVGTRKPDPALFGVALQVARSDPDDAVHVGDSLENDVAGARSMGIEPVLLDRGTGGARDGVTTIASLAELPRIL